MTRPAPRLLTLALAALIVLAPPARPRRQDWPQPIPCRAEIQPCPDLSRLCRCGLPPAPWWEMIPPD
jgi:hypothetical protein